MTGRPSAYTEEQALAICERLSCGESLAQICRDENMPHASTVYKWLNKQPLFVEMYTRAREAQVEPHLEAMFEIADDPTIDPADKRVRIDVRKWAMSKLAPRKYGDKLDLAHTGPDGGPVQVAHANVAELARAVREIAAGRAQPIELEAAPKQLEHKDDSDLL